jgi:hypothetical protein
MSAHEPPDVERLRAALARLGEEPGWPDADTERLFSALHGEMTADERRAVVDELIRNPRAAAAWRLARELAPEQAHAEGRSRRWAWMSAAALVLLAAGAAWQYQIWRAEAPVFRSAEPRTIESRLPVDGRLSRTDPVLLWTAIEGASYRVRVLTPELDLLAEAGDQTLPEYRLPADVVARIASGGRVLWQVEARVPGTAPVVSPTFTVELE